MALDDYQIGVVIGANPKQQGEDPNVYRKRIFEELKKAFFSERKEIDARQHDYMRRLAVLISRWYGWRRPEPITPDEYMRQGDKFVKLHKDLLESYSYKEWPDKRKEVAAVMGIEDKGHSSHGSNFKGNQTLKQIIDNLFAKVSGDKRKAAAEAVIKAYHGYDPR